MPVSKFYNATTFFWHKILRRPIYLKIGRERAVKTPELTVIFLHGISADSGTWKTTFHDISADPTLQNVHLIALDLLGHGKTLHADWLKYDYHDFESALARTIKKLHIDTPIMLVGHSMGGLIAAHYGVYGPQDCRPIRLTLVSPPVLMADELAHLPDKVYTKTYASLHHFAETVPAAETVAHLIQNLSTFRSAYLKTQAFAKSMDNIILNRSNYATFTSLHIPALLLHGHFDPLVIGANLRRAAQHNPKYLKYQSVIGYHDVSVGKRTKIIAEIKKGLHDVKAQTL